MKLQSNWATPDQYVTSNSWRSNTSVAVKWLRASELFNDSMSFWSVDPMATRGATLAEFGAWPVASLLSANGAALLKFLLGGLQGWIASAWTQRKSKAHLIGVKVAAIDWLGGSAVQVGLRYRCVRALKSFIVWYCKVIRLCLVISLLCKSHSTALAYTSKFRK